MGKEWNGKKDLSPARNDEPPIIAISQKCEGMVFATFPLKGTDNCSAKYIGESRTKTTFSPGIEQVKSEASISIFFFPFPDNERVRLRRRRRLRGFFLLIGLLFPLRSFEPLCDVWNWPFFGLAFSPFFPRDRQARTEANKGGNRGGIERKRRML